MEPTLSIIGEPGQKVVGICGSGIIDIISELFRTGIINAHKHSTAGRAAFYHR